jgi:hypothetical protein
LPDPPVAEYAHGQRQQPGLGQCHDQRVDEEVEAEQVDLGLVIRPHQALLFPFRSEGVLIDLPASAAAPARPRHVLTAAQPAILRESQAAHLRK